VHKNHTHLRLPNKPQLQQQIALLDPPQYRLSIRPAADILVDLVRFHDRPVLQRVVDLLIRGAAFEQLRVFPLQGLRVRLGFGDGLVYAVCAADGADVAFWSLGAAL
jgi:hypothetical protein